MLVDAPSSLGGRARARRWEMVRRAFPDIEDARVVDLGGTVRAWESAPLTPRHVTVLNLSEPGESASSRITALMGDACDGVTEIERQTGSASFDIVFSNAVLEHLGGHANRQRFADTVVALAPRHWVQTPYRYFPVEPHWLFPGMQFLPVAARARIARRWRLAHTPARNMEDARTSVMWTELLSLTELRQYFPQSAIVRERVGGLTKSIIAVQA
jgi:hypothetical protein